MRDVESYCSAHRLRLRKVGNTFVVTVPAAVVAGMELQAGDPIELFVDRDNGEELIVVRRADE